MANRKYLIRLDDACPTMNHQNWESIELILDKYGIKPMVGIIPNNEDEKQTIDPIDALFFGRNGSVSRWVSKKWAIALHGYNHCYTSSDGLKGLNPMWTKSEFSGLTLQEQKEKISQGLSILLKNGIFPQYFFAPSHTFDENTLNALRSESNIRIISDTIGFRPYKYKDFVFIPQFGGTCKKALFPGIYTFCLHPSVMSEAQIRHTEDFIKKHREDFIGFSDLDLTRICDKSLFDRCFSRLYFLRRKLKGLR